MRLVRLGFNILKYLVAYSDGVAGSILHALKLGLGSRTLASEAPAKMVTKLLIGFYALTGVHIHAFQSYPQPLRSFTSSVITLKGDFFEGNPNTIAEVPCYWKAPTTGGQWQWQQRINIEDLHVGQKLRGSLAQTLLDGKTGPKLFYEVGVGRTNSSGKWSIVNGMLRLPKAKESVTKKRVVRLRKKKSVDLYISRIQVGCGRLEVCLEEEDVKKYRTAPKIPIASLKEGSEVEGTVVRLLPYGAMIDVGANRLGLLHINKVADLYRKYINKEEGLIKYGLERGARVRLRVDSNERRRLSLGFTDDVKEEAEAESQLESPSSIEKRTNSQGDGSGMTADELAEWADFASIDGTTTATQQQETTVESDGSNEEDDSEMEDDDYDDYDEERDIEDSLGLGFY